MKIEGVVWLEEIVEKLWRKHGVQEHEVIEVFENRPKVRFVEKGHREGEDVYASQGRTDSGKLLIVFFVLRQDRQALILSAREMTASERKKYERK